jgi:hypothetical protein
MEPTMNQQANSAARRRAGTAALMLALCALATAICAPAASARTLHKGFWGPASIEGASQFPTYERLGVTVYQTSLQWSAVAPARPASPKDPADPAYLWSPDLDSLITEAAAHHMEVMLQIVGTPPWANGGKDPRWAPDNVNDYADFARAAARRYPAVRRWMIWGEPSRLNNWQPMAYQEYGAPMTTDLRRAPRRYARMLDAAYGQIKAQRGSNIVIGGNTYVTGDIRPTSWVQSMKLPNGRPPRMDLYGHNPFGFREPDLRKPQTPRGQVDFSDLGRFDKLIQRVLGKPRHKHIALFLSEYAVPTEEQDVELNFHVTLATQAKWITSAFKVARQLDADTLGWIRLRDDAPIPGGVVSHGGLQKFDGTPKPGFYAFMRGGLPAAARQRELARARAD